MWSFFIDGGWFMAVLGLVSLVGLAVILERGWALRWSRVVPDRLLDALEKYRGPDQYSRLREFCVQYNQSPLGRLILIALDHLDQPREEATSSIEVRARQEVVGLERGLVVLEIVVGIAPLLGLLGTIYGLILLFGDIGANGVQDNQSLARGIAVALNTTMMGLLIAVPALTAWSSFSKKVEVMAVELEAICSDFVKRAYQVHPEPLKSNSQNDLMAPNSRPTPGSAKTEPSA